MKEDELEESTGSGETGSRGEREEEGSGSDSEGENGRAGGGQLGPAQIQNSLEMSVWSLDVSLPTGMESSVYEAEVYRP